MTAVLSLNPENRFPLIIGDLLVTSERPHSVLNRIPTFRDTAPLLTPESQNFPSGLRQKIALIGDKLAIAWSGSYVEAADAITHLHSVYRNGDLTFDYLDCYLRNLGGSAPGFVGYLIEGDGYHSFGYRYLRHDTELLGSIGILGSGTNAIESLVRQFENVPLEDRFKSHEGLPPLGNKAIAAAFTIAGSLLTSEVFTGNTLQNSFGAGYEVAFIKDGSFRKVSGVTYAFWKARVKSNGTVRIFPVPLQVCSYAYTGDVLTVHSMALTKRGKEPLITHWCDHVEPVYRHLTDDERRNLPLPPLNNRWHCNYFLIEGLVRTEVLSQIDCRKSGEKGGLWFENIAQSDRVATKVVVEGAFMQRTVQAIRDIAKNVGIRE